MDINYVNKEYQFNLRTSALIFNKTQDKILLFKVKDRNFYLLPGGRIKELEKSSDAIKREIIEELGEDYSNLEFKYICTSEEFVNAKGYNNHQVNIIYKVIYDKKINQILFNGIDSDWMTFEWIDIKIIDNIRIYPSKVKDVIKNSNINHIIED